MRKIAITMGDPYGIGPEVIIKAVSSSWVEDPFIPIVIGDSSVIEKTIKLVDLPLRLKTVPTPSDSSLQEGVLYLIQGCDKRIEPSSPQPTSIGGYASFCFIKKAVELAMAGEVTAIVTAPISKKALSMAGLPYSGHTEILAELTNTKDYAMMLVGDTLRVILVTIHIPLKDVPSLLTTKKVLKTILLAKRGCEMLGIKEPRIAIAGLNPHAGEAGLMGDEEIRIISPAIESAQKQALNALGPYPPDTVFYRAYRGDFDIVVAMYHDEGLIPIKLLAFDKGVNVTVGLPIIRTSPDHGTAYDIAWKGVANPSSMISAIKLALRLSL